MKRVAEQTDYAASVNNSWRGRRCHRTGYLRRQFGLAPGNDPCLMLADDLGLVSAHIFITYSSQGLGFSILCFEFVLSIHWAKKITMLGSAGLVGVLCKFAPIIFPRCHDLVPNAIPIQMRSTISMLSSQASPQLFLILAVQVSESQ